MLRETLDFISEEHGRTMEEFRSLVSQGSITYDLLWALFSPNSLIYRFYPLTEQDQILRSRIYSYEHTQNGDFFFIICDIITNDGDSFGIARVPVQIEKFPGACKIQELAGYPLQYHKDPDDLCERLAARGRRYSQMTGFEYRQISGLAMRETNTDRLEKLHVRFVICCPFYGINP